MNNSKLRLKKKFLNEFHITDEDDVLGSWDKAKLLPGQVIKRNEHFYLFLYIFFLKYIFFAYLHSILLSWAGILN